MEIKGRQQNSQHRAGKGLAHGGGQRPPQFTQLVADTDAGIDDGRSWGHLADGEALHELIVGNPLAFIHQLPFEEGDHGIDAAERKGADFEEDQKNFFSDSMTFSAQLRKST